MPLEHVAINVPEPAMMAAWYADNLGMRVVKASRDEPFIHFVADEHGSLLEFYANPAAPIPDYSAIHPLVLHIAFTVDDMQAARERLIAAGGRAEGDIVTTPAGDQLAFVRDPWQVTIQLVQRAEPLV